MVKGVAERLSTPKRRLKVGSWVSTHHGANDNESYQLWKQSDDGYTRFYFDGGILITRDGRPVLDLRRPKPT